MRMLRTSVSCLAILVGFAAMEIPLSGNAIAAVCRNTTQSVCAVNRDARRTYSSACVAKSEGARVLHAGPCTEPMCTLVMGVVSKPVCGTDPLTHKRMTYPNVCGAELANATVSYDGPCRGKR